MKKIKIKKSKHLYNWLPDLPDQRDFIYSQRVTAPPAVPSHIDLRERCSPVFNQGKIGSCTGNALAGAFEFLELQELRNSTDSDPEVFSKGKFDHASRLFIYYNEREIEGKTDQDGGAMLRDGIKTLVNWGVCRETTWKYGPANVLKKPNVKAYSEAKGHCISNYLRLDSTSNIKQCLAEGYPVAFGFTVYESFESPDVAKSGIMPMPDPSERVLGGHAVLAVGYNDSDSHFIVRNSWGTSWGQNGYFLMPYAYLENAKLAQDFWTIRI